MKIGGVDDLLSVQKDIGTGYAPLAVTAEGRELELTRRGKREQTDLPQIGSTSSWGGKDGVDLASPVQILAGFLCNTLSNFHRARMRCAEHVLCLPYSSTALPP